MNASDTGTGVGHAADRGAGRDPPGQVRLRLLAEEQAALRRVATLVAGRVRPAEVFTAVADELGHLIGAEATFVTRVDHPSGERGEPERHITVVGSYGRVSDQVPVGFRIKLQPGMIHTAALRTGRPARINGEQLATGPFGTIVGELGLRAAVATPIVVRGRHWGVMVAATSREDFPAGTESRMADFMELAATATANAQAEEELRELTEELTRLLAEQAALRRVATFVARGIDPVEIFSAVAEEIRRLLGADIAGMGRFEPDGSVVVFGDVGETPANWPVGTRVEFPGYLAPAVVWRTGHTARVDEDQWTSVSDPFADGLRESGIRSEVASPIMVEGRLWGVVSALTRGTFPSDTAERMADFTELVATAVGNAESRAQLAASRARIVAAADQTRQRIERDLHDGTQQRLVSLGLELGRARGMVPAGLAELETEIGRIADELTAVVEDLREIARGIHPATLSSGGLGPALRTLARRAAIAVQLDVAEIGRLPEPVEVAAYYVVSEALTNATRHAHASVVEVDVEASGGTLRVRVRDDGAGGADPVRGSGLIGLKDRIEALRGTFSVHSPVGGGTTVSCQLPVPGDAGQPGAGSGQ